MKAFPRILAMIQLAVISFTARGADLTARENEYYKMITIPVPQGMILEAGALQWMPSGQLAVSTRLGNIYLVDNVLDDPPRNVKFHLFASGLHEVLGLTVDKAGVLYCTQRGEVTRMKDLDHDGRADLFETVSDLW